jgi:hypothetical protein
MFILLPKTEQYIQTNADDNTRNNLALSSMKQN